MIQDSLLWSERILALAIFFQTIELLQLKSIWQETGIWRWSQIRDDFSSSPRMQIFLDLFLSDRRFLILLILRLLASISVLILSPHAISLGVLFLSTWLISIRWRGVFNGGSDSMTAVVAAGLFVGEVFSRHESILKASLAYIAVQVTLSYFIAGVVKLKNADWRSGVALPIFLNTPRYDSPAEWIQKAFNHKRLSLIASWAVIIFECLFPMAWMSPNACLIFLGGAFVFHVFNFLTFGLNRFVFAWLAGYPALFYWSHHFISQKSLLR